MEFTRRVDTAAKYVKSTNTLNHHITCTQCNAIQDFDHMPLAEAKKAIVEAGWREGKDEDKVFHPVCPECVEELEVTNKSKHELEYNSYD